MEQNKEQIQHQMDTDYMLYACLTIMAWDILENLAEDVQLLTEHRLKFPSIVYFTSRASTLAFLLACSLNTRDNCIGFAVTCQCLLAIHRGSTSLLLYLRVHALYRSNESIRSIFVFLFTMIIAFSMIYWLPKGDSQDALDTTGLRCLAVLSTSPVLFWTSAMTSCGFDILLFTLIAYKLGGSANLSSRKKENSSMWRFLSLQTPLHQMTHRLFQDTLAYFLLAVLVKTPQIILLPVGGAKWQLLILFADAALICVLSGRIFRHMKLGLPGVLPTKEALRLAPPPLPDILFAEPSRCLPVGSQQTGDTAATHVSTTTDSDSGLSSDNVFIYH